MDCTAEKTRFIKKENDRYLDKKKKKKKKVAKHRFFLKSSFTLNDTRTHQRTQHARTPAPYPTLNTVNAHMLPIYIDERTEQY